MEISTNELFALIFLALFCWKIRQALDDAERRAKRHLRALTTSVDRSRADPVPASAMHSTSTAVQEGGVVKGLRDIEKVDRSFDATWFLQNANIAYEKIIAAFAHGDRKLLRALLTGDVYETFAHEIDDRESRDEHVEFTFIRLTRSKIVDAGVFDGRMEISVAFNSEIVIATRNSAGVVVAGEPTQVIDICDLWSFVKERPTSPIWKLARTESPIEKHEGALEGRILQPSGV